eukprot:6207411-Pleurochrysis_carterae.AAC.1
MRAVLGSGVRTYRANVAVGACVQVAGVRWVGGCPDCSHGVCKLQAAMQFLSDQPSKSVTGSKSRVQVSKIAIRLLRAWQTRHTVEKHALHRPLRTMPQARHAYISLQLHRSSLQDSISKIMHAHEYDVRSTQLLVAVV